MRTLVLCIATTFFMVAAMSLVAVRAADLAVDADEWDKLSAGEKTQITDTMKKFRPNDTIVPVKSAKKTMPKINFCEIACNAAAAACFAECAGAPVCTALCEAGRQECLKHC